jgi:uncharacterized delta-60 repeat protein
LSTDGGVTWASANLPASAGSWKITCSADAQNIFAGSGGGFCGGGLLCTLPSSESVAPAPPAPRLAIALSGQSLDLSWLVPSRAFVLQQSLDFGDTNWSNIPTPPTLNFSNLNLEVALPRPSNTVFYRLKSPVLIQPKTSFGEPPIIQFQPALLVSSVCLASVGLAAQPTNLCSTMPDSAVLVDQTFQPPPSEPCNFVSAIVQQPDGKILVSAYCADGTMETSSSLIRLNPDGSLDTSFNLDSRVTRLESSVFPLMQPDGRILIGAIVLIKNENRPGIVRLNGDGSLDTSFMPGVGGDGIYAVLLQPDGKVLVGGLTLIFDGTQQANIARLNPDGSLDRSFASVFGSNDTSGSIYAMAQQSDGKVMVGGVNLAVNGAPAPELLRLNSDGSIDPGYVARPGGHGCPFPIGVSTILLQPDNKAIVSAGCLFVNGIDGVGMARLNSDGSLDETFNASFPGSAWQLESDGKLLGFGLSGLVRLNSDGSVDNTFIATAEVTNGAAGPGQISTFAALPNGRVMIGGNFTEVNCVSRTGIARLISDANVIVTGLTGLVNDHFTLTITSEPKKAYALETSADLIHWGPVTTNTAAGLTVRCLDPASAGAPLRFYRTRTLPQ